jgi:leader peptidase (prepilin peptidase)/N-methyltransferase
LSRLVFGCALLVLFAIDLEHHLLPNVITLPGIIVGFVFSIFTEPGWLASLIGIVVGGGVLFLVAETYYRVRREEGLGMGDVKMLAMVGAFVGWQLTLLTLMLASFSGTIIGLALIVSKRGGMKYALPFGTFLALGAAAAATVGPAILHWYLRL